MRTLIVTALVIIGTSLVNTQNTCSDYIGQELVECVMIIVSSQLCRTSKIIKSNFFFQTNNPTTALCPGTQCRILYENILDACDGIPDTEDVLNAVRNALDTFDDVCKSMGGFKCKV